MAGELRRITFNNHEVREAAVNYCLRSHVRMPEANIDTVDIKDDDDAFITLRFTTVSPSDTSRVALNRSQAAAAMLVYCRVKGIPVPRDSQKLIRAGENGTLVLLIRIADPESEAEAPGPSGKADAED